MSERHGRFRGAARVLARLRFTVGFLVVMWTVGLVTGTVRSGPRGALLHAVGFGMPSLLGGRWWTVISSVWWAGGLAQYLGVTVVVGLLCGLAERQIGTVATAAAFFSAYVGGALLSLGVVAAGVFGGDPWSARLAEMVVVTPSAAAFGAGMAASAALTPVWRRRLRLTLITTMTMLTLYAGALQALIRLCAGLVGLALVPLLVPRDRRPAGVAASRVEERFLIAMLVAASAIGPLVATTPLTPGGPPLSILQYLLTAPHPSAADVSLACGDPSMADVCGQLRAALRLDGAGSAVLSVIPALIMGVMAEGLRRGRRFAWWGALGANSALTVFGLFLLPSALAAEAGLGSLRDWSAVAVPLVQPALIIVLLVAHRSKFDVRAPRGAYRHLGMVLGTTWLACAVLYVAGAYAVRDQFDHPPGLSGILVDLPLRFAPPDYLGELPITFLPLGGLAVVFYEWTGVVFWCVALAGCALTFVRARIDAPPTDRARARALLHRYGGTSTSHMITWPGHGYWFSEDGQAVIAYRVRSAVALTTGGPVGEPDACRTASRQFARYCASQGWTPCFYAITDALRTDLGAGWRAVQVAEEAVVRLGQLHFRGKKFQDVRTALNKAKALGIEAHRIRYRDASPRLAEQIRRLSAEWLANKRLPEMGFTLGTVEELADDDVWCVVAVDPAGNLHGVTSWLPVRRDGRIIGWTLDLMRRSPAAFPGVMEFLIATMALSCRSEGVEVLSLSGAPLARMDRGERRDLLQRFLDFVGLRLEPVYGFRSLLAFKAKFRPQYQPLFMAYPDAAALPSIGNAVTRAYLPRLTAQQAVRLLWILLAIFPRNRSRIRGNHRGAMLGNR
ncbi:DUF2156 domain-containing protein [Amycolatopsis rhizosphaerae]|uniref:DUF2156 domain-containing protein n=1 Tax=Amycolatopsis rhizosphaerae TaxID=2053003 RepID=A0A558AKS8_9PSEU|nr:DUF2156 domain-containing protein [Amycolatopsis rhizosphaerae]TVT24860.1 DUF2156 domain-containing protein [Amycolatopsis rhizosphaerae]